MIQQNENPGSSEVDILSLRQLLSDEGIRPCSHHHDLDTNLRLEECVAVVSNLVEIDDEADDVGQAPGVFHENAVSVKPIDKAVKLKIKCPYKLCKKICYAVKLCKLKFRKKKRKKCKKKCKKKCRKLC